MQIFLQILAVIGIILLCIIGLILLVLGLVLFVPIRYKIKAHKETETVLQIRATWLLHFLSIIYIYPEPGEIVVRILGAKVWKMKIGEEKTDDAPEAETTEQEGKSAISKSAESEVTPKEEKESVEKEPKKIEAEKTEAEKAEAENEEKTNVFEKIQYKIKSICDKIKKIFNNYEYYKDLLQQKENSLLFDRCKNRLFKVLKHLKPRVLKAEIIVGTGEPDTTGYLMAIYGMLIPVLGSDINITPDFEQKILEGRLYAKGRVRVATLLNHVVRIYFDEQLHNLLDNIQRKDV